MYLPPLLPASSRKQPQSVLPEAKVVYYYGKVERRTSNVERLFDFAATLVFDALELFTS